MLGGVNEPDAVTASRDRTRHYGWNCASEIQQVQKRLGPDFIWDKGSFVLF
jgi:hypothetical protein